MPTKSAKQGKPVAKSKPKVQTATKGVQIVKDNKYPCVPRESVRIVERPKEGEETTKLFYNPRGEDAFQGAKMEHLGYSIRVDGLIEPLAGRPVMGANETILFIELIAGERRKREIDNIATNDLPCFDEDEPKPKVYKAGDIVLCATRFGKVVKQEGQLVSVQFDKDHIGEANIIDVPYMNVLPTVLGSKMYTHVPMKLYYNCTDERAMRLNFTENKDSDPLAVKDEIALVERLERMDKKQEEIAEMLNTNVTFVSQTRSFRHQLPAEAFQKLLDGKMARHVAVNILSYSPEDRDAYFEFMKAEEKLDTARKITKNRSEQERLEDEAEQHLSNAKKADEAGDEAAAAKERRRAKSLEAKAGLAKARKKKAEAEEGVIKTGHGKRAAAKGNLMPKKAKMLDKEQIEEKYVKGMALYCTEDLADPITGEDVPCDLASIVQRTAQAILIGNYDPLSVIREFMVESERWALPENTKAGKKKTGKGADEDEEADEATLEDGGDDDEDDEEELDPRFCEEGDENYDPEEDFGGQDFDLDKYNKEWN